MTGLQIIPSGKPSLPKEYLVHVRVKDKCDVLRWDDGGTAV